MPTTVYKGCKGEDVVLCQERLNTWHYPVDIDGDFGPATETAAMEFQSDHSLVPDGIVGDLTWNDLLKAPTSAFPVPPYSPLLTAILCETAWYAGWDYTASGGESLVARGSRLAPASVTWQKGKKTDTVCSVQLGGILGCVYDAVAKWSEKAWANIQILDADRPWSMIDELISASVGVAYVSIPEADKVYAAQGWNGLENGKIVSGSSGHQFIMVGPDLILESTTWTDEDANGSSTDPGDSSWRHRPWSETVNRYEELRLVELVSP